MRLSQQQSCGHQAELPTRQHSVAAECVQERRARRRLLHELLDYVRDGCRHSIPHIDRVHHAIVRHCRLYFEVDRRQEARQVPRPEKIPRLN